MAAQRQFLLTCTIGEQAVRTKRSRRAASRNPSRGGGGHRHSPFTESELAAVIVAIDTMGVAGEILEHLLGVRRKVAWHTPPTAWRAVDRRVLGSERDLPTRQEPVEVETSAAKRCSRRILPRPGIVAAGNPGGSVGCQATARDDAVEMGMVHQGLAPGVQHGDEADISAEMLRVGGDLRVAAAAANRAP